MKTHLFRFVAYLLVSSFVTNSWGALDLVNDDTDIFMVNPAVSSARPNVLIMLDNSSNWGQSSTGTPKFDNEKPALISAVGALTDQFNVGLMMFMPQNESNTLGGYVRYGIRQMSGSITDISTNKGRLASLVDNLHQTNDNTASSLTYAHGMFEAYRYFMGGNAPFGTNATKRDFTGNNLNGYVLGLTDNPLSSSSDTSYTSPVSDKCQKNFIILMSNGYLSSSNLNTDSFGNLLTINSAANELTPTTSITFPTMDGNTASAVPDVGRWADEYASWMSNNDCAPQTGKQPVFTYVVEVDPGIQSQDRQFSAWLSRVAAEGQGKYIPVTNDATAIKNALDAIFQEIQAVNSVFASTTLPVSNNVRGTNLNQVYIGVFRPDGNRSPRWFGNLKMYQFGPNLDQLYDNNSPSVPAYNPTTGFTYNTAKSFWTTPSSYWGFRSPNYEATDIGKASDSPDGDLVEKGGAAQRLRTVYSSTQSARKVYTCTTGCAANTSLSATPFTTANTDITATDLKAFSTVGLSSITSSAATATATTSSPHGFGAVNATVSGITISGASPDNYNGTYTVTVTGTNTFTYTMTSVPTANSAHVVTSTAHNLNAGDLVTVNASPAGYVVTDSPVLASGLTSTAFNYVMSSSETTAATVTSVVAKKLISTLTGSGTTAKATIVGHGYASGNLVTVTGATPSAFNVTNKSITVVDADTFIYSTDTTIFGSSNTALLTATAHGFSDGNSIVIAGATPSAYNGTYVISYVDANTFSYTTGSSVSTSATGTITASIGGVISGAMTTLSNGSGGNRPTATAVVSAGHGLGSSGTVTLSVSGAVNTAFNKTNVTATITSSTAFTYSLGCTGAACPAASSTTTGASYNSSNLITKTVSALVPLVAATGTKYAAKTLSNVTSISLQTSATVTNATVGNTNSGDATLRQNIINWVRGQDNKEDENKNASTTDARSSIHGDVLHSRPAVVNYGRDGTSNDIVVFYGTNDGIFRAQQGGVPTDGTGGNELWSFVAPEFFGKLKRQMDNAPVISGSVPRDYFFDGSIGVYTLDVNSDGKLVAADGDKVYLYLTMRRGGRMIYALDVSDPTNPKFMWKRGCPNLTNNTGCDTGWDEIGQTWSEPRVGYVRANTNPVLMFSAGYDPQAEDFQPCLVTARDDSSSPATVTGLKNGATTYLVNGACYMLGGTSTAVSRSKGRGIFFIDAVTGNMVWRVGPDSSADKVISSMLYAMPSDISIVNRDRDISRAASGKENVGTGYIDRVYAVDTSGGIWRLDVDNSVKSKWVVNKVASLSGSTLAEKRKFLYSPRLVYDASCGNFDALVLGSGDREHPFSAAYYTDPSVAHSTSDVKTDFQDRMYMIRDPNTGLLNAEGTLDAGLVSSMAFTTIANSDLFDATSNCVQDCTGAAQTTAKTALSSARGWYFDLRAGEKVVTTTASTAGVIEFATNQPKGSAGTDSCTGDLGVAREYRVNFCDASVPASTWTSGVTGALKDSRSKELNGGGYVPSPTPAVICKDGNCKQLNCFGPECHNPVTLELNQRKRTYWYKKSD